MFRDVKDLQVAYNNRSHTFDLKWSSEEKKLADDTSNARFKWYVVKFWSGKKTADPTHMEVVTTTLEHLTYKLKRFVDTYPKYIEISANAESLNPNDGVYIEYNENGQLVKKNCGRPMNSTLSGIARWTSVEITNLDCKYHPENGKLVVQWQSAANFAQDFNNFNVDLFVGHVYLDKYTKRDSTVRTGSLAPDGKTTVFTASFNLNEFSLDEDEYQVIVTPIAANGSEMGEGAVYTFIYDPENLKRNQFSTVKKEVNKNSIIERTGHLEDFGFHCTNVSDGSTFKPNEKDCCRYDFAWKPYGKYTRYKLSVTGTVENMSYVEDANGKMKLERSSTRTDAAATGVTEIHVSAVKNEGYVLFHEPGTYHVQLTAHDGPQYLLSAKEVTIVVTKESLRPQLPLNIDCVWQDSKVLKVSWDEPKDVVHFYRIGLSSRTMQSFSNPDYDEATKKYVAKVILSNQTVDPRGTDSYQNPVFKGRLERVRVISAGQENPRDLEYINLTNGVEFEVPVRL